MPVEPNNQWEQQSANTLAFVGDAVFALFIRERLTRRSPGTVHRLHTASTRYVKASAQARIALAMMDELDEDERAVFMRGRNAKTVSMPKNAELQDYRHATGFEAVVGFLHLEGRTERLKTLLEKAASIIESNQPNGGNP
jgi:ribonuclease III family protein